ncbi:hypothetical protein AB0O91_28705 [Kitasatospora sp. NPDC089797]|uniref:hypothetical protein n=1 Tax=Kitasatospora sp. NPDC089797 TaxID=3155298 RepID=UPI003425CD5C
MAWVEMGFPGTRPGNSSRGLGEQGPCAGQGLFHHLVQQTGQLRGQQRAGRAVILQFDRTEEATA